MGLYLRLTWLLDGSTADEDNGNGESNLIPNDRHFSLIPPFFFRLSHSLGFSVSSYSSFFQLHPKFYWLVMGGILTRGWSTDYGTSISLKQTVRFSKGSTWAVPKNPTAHFDKVARNWIIQVEK